MQFHVRKAFDVVVLNLSVPESHRRSRKTGSRNRARHPDTYYQFLASAPIAFRLAPQVVRKPCPVPCSRRPAKHSRIGPTFQVVTIMLDPLCSLPIKHSLSLISSASHT